MKKPRLNEVMFCVEDDRWKKTNLIGKILNFSILLLVVWELICF